MRIKTRLLLGLAIVAVLLTFQSVIYWRYSAHAEHDLAQIRRMMLHDFRAADEMSAELDRLDASALAILAKDASTPRPQVTNVLANFHQSLSIAMELNQRAAKMASVEKDEQQLMMCRQLADALVAIQAACGRAETAWQHAKMADTFPYGTPGNLRQLRDQLDPALFRYRSLLKEGMFLNIEHIVMKSKEFSGWLIVYSLLIAGAMVGAMILLSSLVLKPLNHLVSVSRDITSGRHGRRLHMKRQDEFGLMASAFNQMLDQLQASSGSCDDLEKAVRQRTAELQASEESLSTTLQSIGDGVLTTDAKGCITKLNRVAESLTGWKSAEAAGLPIEQVFVVMDEESGAQVTLPVSEVIRRREILELQSRCILVSRDGLRRPIADSCAPIRDLEGMVTGTVLVFRDVTIERAAARELHEQEEMLRSLSNNIPSGATYRLIRGGGGAMEFQYVSDGIERLVGVTAAEILDDSRRLFYRIQTEDLEKMTTIGDAAQANMSQFDCQTRIQATDGSVKWIHWRSSPQRLSSGETVWAGLIVDITPLKDAQAQLLKLNQELEALVAERTSALAESERRHRVLLSNLQGLAYRFQADTGHTTDYISDGCMAMLGLHPRSVSSRAGGYDVLIHAGDQAYVRREVDLAFTNGGRFSIEYRLKGADGQWRWVWEQGRGVEDAEGGIAAIEGYIVDITKRRNMEEALAQQQDRLSTIFAALPSGVGVARNRIISEVNERICDLSGHSMEELIGKNTRIFYASDEDYERAGGALYKAADEGKSTQIEARWLRKNGQIFDVLICASAISADDPAAIVFSVTDITDFKRAENLARTLSQAVEQSPVAVIITNPRGCIEYVNPRFSEVTGYSAQEVMGRNPKFLKSGDTSPEDYSKMWSTITAGGQWRGQFHNKKKNGDSFWEIVSISPIRDGNGAVSHFIAVKEDITERREASERLREQAALLDESRDAVLVVGLDRRIKYLNRSARQFYAGQAGELESFPAGKLLFPERPEHFEDACKITMEKGDWTDEVRHALGPKPARTIHSRWTLMRNPAGSPTGFLVFNTDITEKKRLEEQFLRAQRMESVGTLASGVAHDLNNVLTPILMAVTLLQEKSAGGANESLLRMMRDGVTRGAGIIQQLLMFGRGMEGKREALQPTTLLAEMGKVIKETFPPNILLEQELPSDIRNIHADATQIHQVLLNLCVNARDAMPAGGRLRISARNEMLDECFVRSNPESKAGAYVVLEVQDTGEGISSDVMHKIFDPFFTTKEQGRGTGLGLSTVVGIVRSHQGFVQVSSSRGHGTMFSIYFPAVSAVAGQLKDSPSATLPQGGGRLVLVVEDEEPIREVASRILEANGYRVVSAPNGADGLVAFVNHKEEIALVLTDMVMPVMDGSTFVRVIRSYSSDVRVVAMSGLVEQQQYIPSSFKFSALLRKPFTADRLLTTLGDALGIQRN